MTPRDIISLLGKASTCPGRRWWRYQANVLYYVNKAKRIPSRSIHRNECFEKYEQRHYNTHLFKAQAFTSCKKLRKMRGENTIFLLFYRKFYSILFYFILYFFLCVCVWIIYIDGYLLWQRWINEHFEVWSKCYVLKARDCSCEMHE